MGRRITCHPLGDVRRCKLSRKTRSGSVGFGPIGRLNRICGKAIQPVSHITGCSHQLLED